MMGISPAIPRPGTRFRSNRSFHVPVLKSEGSPMKLRLATACALATFALAGSAFAEARISATLEAPKPAKTKLIAAHAVFVCQDATCFAGIAPDEIGRAHV